MRRGGNEGHALTKRRQVASWLRSFLIPALWAILETTAPEDSGRKSVDSITKQARVPYPESCLTLTNVPNT